MRPEIESSDELALKAKRSNRRQLVLIAVIAAVSVAGSYTLYFNTTEGGVWGTTNNGKFIDPPVRAQALGLVNPLGEPFDTEDSWWVWLVQRGECTTQCDETLFQMRQMHVLLHKNAKRLRRGLVRTTQGTSTGSLTDKYPQLRQLNMSTPADGTDVPLVPEGLYIVDPLGNLVMRYNIEAMGKPVLQDLKRLLKVSQIG